MPRRPRRRTTGHAHRSRPTTAGPRPGFVSTACLRGVTRHPLLSRCHAAAAHTPPPARCLSPLAGAPPHVANCLRAHANALWTWSLSATSSSCCAAYKPPHCFPCVCAAVAPFRRRPPLAPPVSFPLRLCPWPANDSKLLPNLHSSSHSDPWLSSAPHCTKNRAAAEAPPLPRRRPSPGASLIKPPTLIDHMWAQSTLPLACSPSPAIAGDQTYNFWKACIYFWAIVFAWKIEMYST
jgi:hypothetical protein